MNDLGSLNKGKKGASFWVYLLVIILTAAVAGGATWYFVDTKASKDKDDLQTQIDDLQTKVDATSTSTTAAATSSTANASDNTLAYTNTKYGYSLAYPKTWTINTLANSPAENNISPSFDSVCNYDAGDHCLQLMVDRSLAYNADLNYYVSGRGTLISKENTTFAGEPAIKVVSLANSGTPSSYPQISLIFVHNKQQFIITYAESGKDLVGTTSVSAWKNTAVFGTILASFKFTSSATTINKDIESVDFSKVITVNTAVGDKLLTPIYADLNADNSEEALVAYQYAGTGAVIDFYVYGEKNSSPTLLLKKTGFSGGSVSIKNGSVYLDYINLSSALNTGKPDSDFQVDTHKKFTWNGSTFAESNQ